MVSMTINDKIFYCSYWMLRKRREKSNIFKYFIFYFKHFYNIIFIFYFKYLVQNLYVINYTKPSLFNFSENLNFEIFYIVKKNDEFLKKSLIQRERERERKEWKLEINAWNVEYIVRKRRMAPMPHINEYLQSFFFVH